MSRGVVLWPDSNTAVTIEALWKGLEDVEAPSLATLTHRRHRPHTSLIVGEELDPQAAIEALGPTPEMPIPLRIESVGAFPEGVLFLACVMNDQLLAEHRRVADRVGQLVVGVWPYFARGAWTPHITLATGLDPAQTARGLDVALRALPIEGYFVAAGVEDGTTGDEWPLPSVL